MLPTPANPEQHIIILCPVFNDEESLNVLLKNLERTFEKTTEIKFSFLIINDGSTESLKVQPVPHFDTHVLHLKRNIGHQKAIAIGLVYIKHHLSCDKVIVMDSDGEDRPEDVVILLQHSKVHPVKIAFAYRKSRQEGTQFRLFYRLYKFAFRLLTGRTIAFGNFMIIPSSLLDKLVYYSEIWNHLPGGILKSGLPFTSVVTHRGKRFSGRSKMDFTSLFMHGLGAISVFIDVIASRLLIFSMVMISISILAILTIIGIKAFTNLAIPGWTSTVVSSMLVVLLQSFLLSLFTIFLYLSSQSQRKFIPAHHYQDYAGTFETITHG